MLRVPMIETEDGFGPDLPEGFRGRATLTEDGDYLLTPEGSNLSARFEALLDRLESIPSDANAAKVRDDVRAAAAEARGRP